MFSWFKVLWNLQDSRLLEINGIDYTLYLVMLRYFAVFMALITCFNAVVMLPTYLTGHPIGNSSPNLLLNSTMDKITVLNVSGVDWKVNFSYFLSILLVSTMIVLMLQQYRSKYESWKKLRSPNVDFKTDTDVAHHSIMIKNLPTNVPPELLEKRICSVLRDVFNK